MKRRADAWVVPVKSEVQILDEPAVKDSCALPPDTVIEVDSNSEDLQALSIQEACQTTLRT